MEIERYLKKDISEFLKKRMVFVGGPRQVGNTTLCLSFLKVRVHVILKDQNLKILWLVTYLNIAIIWKIQKGM